MSDEYIYEPWKPRFADLPDIVSIRARTTAAMAVVDMTRFSMAPVPPVAESIKIAPKVERKINTEVKPCKSCSRAKK